MSTKEFDDECSGCRPAMMDVKTKTMMPDDSPTMRTVLRIWNRLTLADKRAWHRFTCLQSRAIGDLAVAKRFSEAVEKALTQQGAN
jgi:hypothetical protein